MDETLGAARRRLASRFAEADIETADLDARLLLCAAAGLDHAALIRDSELALDARASARLENFAVRRLRREPVTRILGRREFWGLDFAVTPAVLDPRPETEGLVASALDAIGGRRAAPLRIVDLGTGSGALLAALLKELPRAWGLGIDRSEPACRVARANLARHGLAGRSAVVCADWTGAVRGPFDLVVANPPYIASYELAGLAREVREHDPPQALDGGFDGLESYRAIVPSLAALLDEGGVACFECGTGQGGRIEALLMEAGFAGAAVYKDLAGHDRVVIAVRPS